MNRADRRKYAKKINTPEKLQQYTKHFDNKVRQEYKKIFEEKYHEDLSNAIDIFILSIYYTLHFNEITNFDNEQIKDFMEDLLATVNNFNDGSYSPNEYAEILRNDGIEIKTKGDK